MQGSALTHASWPGWGRAPQLAAPQSEPSERGLTPRGQLRCCEESGVGPSVTLGGLRQVPRGAALLGPPQPPDGPRQISVCLLRSQNVPRVSTHSSVPAQRPSVWSWGLSSVWPRISQSAVRPWTGLPPSLGGMTLGYMRTPR